MMCDICGRDFDKLHKQYSMRYETHLDLCKNCVLFEEI